VERQKADVGRLDPHSDLLHGGLRMNISLRDEDEEDREPNSSHVHFLNLTFYSASSALPAFCTEAVGSLIQFSRVAEKMSSEASALPAKYLTATAD
jgi:hypothetical protein